MAKWAADKHKRVVMVGRRSQLVAVSEAGRPIDALDRAFGMPAGGRQTAKAEGKCLPPPIGCGGVAGEFRDEISRREYGISGLCQKCQDEVFKPRKG